MIHKRFLMIAVGSLAIAGLMSLHLRAAAESPSGKEPVVVELFTSEGCSSCPPADALLGKIIKQAKEDGRSVFALSFHVDYWNSLGWRDPFSDPSYSDRQRQYSEWFKLDSIYTPQLIINGTEQFVGSDSDKAQRSIAAAQSAKTVALLSAKATVENGGLVIEVSSDALGTGTVLNVAVVERGLVSKVNRGENGGRTLHHENVVRWFNHQAWPDTKQLRVMAPIPQQLDPAHASIIVYAQRRSNGQVIAASEIEMPPIVANRPK